MKMKIFLRKKSLLAVTATILAISSPYAADQLESPRHYQDATPKREQPFRPGGTEKARATLKLFKEDPAYIRTFKRDEYPLLTKANIISTDTSTYVGSNSNKETIEIESNAEKLKKALETLNGNPPTKEQVESKPGVDFGYFTDPIKTETTKDGITINKPVRFKRVALAALALQNDDLLAADSEAYKTIEAMVEGTVVYNHPNEIRPEEGIEPKKHDNNKPIFEVVKSDLTSAIIDQYTLNPNAKMACVIAADSENVGGGHIDGVTATIEEAVVYTIPELSPVLGILAQAHAYPLPEKGGMYIPHANIRRAYETNRLISKTPVDLIFSVAYDLREKKDFARTPEYLQGTQEKISAQLKIAAENKVETLFLSAYGCGVFGNESSYIANVYKDLIDTHCQGTTIKKIVFAIIDGPEKTRLNFRKEVVENKNSIFFEVFS